MDVLELDAASHGLIDQIREVIDAVNYNPARDKHRIYILDEVHMLSTGAFNALLKTLEEPPPHVIFIMATTEYHKIPATILSRCQQYAFKLIPFPLIRARLEQIARAENIQIGATALEHVVFASGGSMRDAMSAFDQVIAFSGPTVRDEDVILLLGLIEPAILEDTVRAVATHDAEKTVRVVSNLVEAGHDLQNFWRRLLAHFRNLMVLKAGVADSSILGVPETLIPQLRSQADLFSREDLLRLYDALFKIEGELKYASQVRFQVEMGLIELSQIARMRSLEQLVDEFSRLSRGEGGATPDPRPSPGTSQPGGGRAGGTDSSPQQERKGPTATAPDRPDLAPATPPASGEGSAEFQQGDNPDERPRDLLLKIAGSVQKASLEPVLLSLSGAELRNDVVVLDPGTVNEFFRRQIRENLSVVAQAAAAVVGHPVRVQLGQESPQPAVDAPPARIPVSSSPGQDLMQRLQQEPVVRSFLDVFPGPVRAEKIDK
jgi:DNA polymerase-3 subunit gamma/tau